MQRERLRGPVAGRDDSVVEAVRAAAWSLHWQAQCYLQRQTTLTFASVTGTIVTDVTPGAMASTNRTDFDRTTFTPCLPMLLGLSARAGH